MSMSSLSVVRRVRSDCRSTMRLLPSSADYLVSAAGGYRLPTLQPSARTASNSAAARRATDSIQSHCMPAF